MTANLQSIATNNSFALPSSLSQLSFEESVPNMRNNLAIDRRGGSACILLPASRLNLLLKGITNDHEGQIRQGHCGWDGR